MVLLEIGLGSFGSSGHILAGSTPLTPCLRPSDPRLHPTTAVSLFTRVPQHCSVMVPNSFAISFYKVKGVPYPVVTLPEPAYPHPLHSIILLSHHFWLSQLWIRWSGSRKMGRQSALQGELAKQWEPCWAEAPGAIQVSTVGPLIHAYTTLSDDMLVRLLSSDH